MKNQTLSSRSGVNSSTWPRWAMSRERVGAHESLLGVGAGGPGEDRAVEQLAGGADDGGAARPSSRRRRLSRSISTSK